MPQALLKDEQRTVLNVHLMFKGLKIFGSSVEVSDEGEFVVAEANRTLSKFERDELKRLGWRMTRSTREMWLFDERYE